MNIIFGRFGGVEMNSLAMTKYMAMKQKNVQNEYSNLPKLDPQMPCGLHSDAAACLNALTQRLFGVGMVNNKKPNQFSSNEFKQIIGTLVLSKNNNCKAVTLADIVSKSYHLKQ